MILDGAKLVCSPAYSSILDNFWPSFDNPSFSIRFRNQATCLSRATWSPNRPARMTPSTTGKCSITRYFFNLEGFSSMLSRKCAKNSNFEQFYRQNLIFHVFWNENLDYSSKQRINYCLFVQSCKQAYNISSVYKQPCNDNAMLTEVRQLGRKFL